MGLAADPLVGSDDWWEQIRTGDRLVHRLDGTITRAYWASMADWQRSSIGSPVLGAVTTTAAR
jgi:hypothetical protein